MKKGQILALFLAFFGAAFFFGSVAQHGGLPRLSIEDAKAQVSIPFPGPGNIAKQPPSIVYQNTYVSTSPSGNVYTFASAALGTADPTRCMIVGVSSTISGGTSASGNVAGTGTTTRGEVSGSTYSGILTAAVPTGTSGTITVTLANTFSRMRIGVWAAYNMANSCTGLTPTAVTSTANPLVLSQNTLAGDLLVIVASSQNTPGSMTFPSGFTKQYDATMGGDSGAGGNATETVNQSPRTMAVVGAVLNPTGISAIFR